MLIELRKRDIDLLKNGLESLHHERLISAERIREIAMGVADDTTVEDLDQNLLALRAEVKLLEWLIERIYVTEKEIKDLAYHLPKDWTSGR